jgi:hypothetical protein
MTVSMMPQVRVSLQLRAGPNEVGGITHLCVGTPTTTQPRHDARAPRRLLRAAFQLFQIVLIQLRP